MIKVQSFSSENLIPVLSGIICQNTDEKTYELINILLHLIPIKEAAQETYLILSALDSLQEIYSYTKLTPDIHRDQLKGIIENNIYEELKENTKVGFAEYAISECQVTLNFFQEDSVATVAARLLSKIDYILEQAEQEGFTLQQSSSELHNLQKLYLSSLMDEAGKIISMLSNSDFSVITQSFWGWKNFLFRNKIFGLDRVEFMLSVLSDFIRQKKSWVAMQDAPLTSIRQVIKLKDKYIETSTPLLTTAFLEFNEIVKFTAHEVTLLVAEKGLGKTTFASMVAGFALAQGLRVLFYCPELPDYKLLYDYVLPAYIRARYGFVVTAQQCLGLEEPYAAGSDYTQEEKKEMIKIAEEELVKSGSFFHKTERFQAETIISDLVAVSKSFNPSLLIFDHTQEVFANGDMNYATSQVGLAVKQFVTNFKAHAFVLSHPGSGFTAPTQEKPIVTAKINAWSGVLEQLSDNILGAVRMGKTGFALFTTKLRWHSLMPMYLVFQMVKQHNWFEYRPEDQFIQSESTENVVNTLLQGMPLMMDESDDDDLWGDE